MTELSDAVAAAKRAALDTLSSKHGLTDLSIDDTFRAVVAAPQFVFTALRPISARHPYALWELRTHEEEAYSDRETQDLAKAWLSIMITQFSQVSSSCRIPNKAWLI